MPLRNKHDELPSLPPQMMTEEEIHTACDSLVSDIYKAAEAQGLVSTLTDKTVDPDSKQYFNGKIPNDLHQLPSEELGKYLVMCSSHIDRLAKLEANFRVERGVAEIRFKKIFDVVRSKSPGTEGGKERAAALDRASVSAEMNYLFYKSLHTLIEGALSAAERNYSAASRIIALRTEGDAHQQRMLNVVQERPSWKRK